MSYKLVMEGWKKFLRKDTAGENISELTITGADSGCSLNKSCKCVLPSMNLSVSQIQDMLVAVYGINSMPISFKSGKADGDCGEETQNLIMKFQVDNDLKCDGCVGPETLPILQKLAGGKVTKKPKSDVKKVEPASTAVVTTSGDTGQTISLIGTGYTHGSKRKGANVIPGIINAVHIHTILAATGLFTFLPGREKYGFGNPVVADALSAAGQSAKNVSPDSKNPLVIGNLSTKNGGPMPFSSSHQVGLDVDTSLYSKVDKGARYWDAVRGFKDLDIPRNVAFLASLLKSTSPRVYHIFTDNTLKALITRHLKQNASDPAMAEVLELWNSIRNDRRLAHWKGHRDHFHIRFTHPQGSMTVAQYKKTSRNRGMVASTKKSTKSRGSLIEKLKKSSSSGFGYVIGRPDGTIIDSHNEGRKFYGASIQKTMAAMAQLIAHKENPAAQMNDDELRGLLTYRRRTTGDSSRYPDSNQINRSISKSFNRRASNRRVYRRRPNVSESSSLNESALGRVSHEEIKDIAKNFGVEDSKFLWGSVNNQQTPKDFFNFFATLSRMDTGKFKDSKEEAYYNTYKQEIDKIISIQKEGTARQKSTGWLNDSGVFNFGNVWMKGGYAIGAGNIALVLDNKYVIVVYTRFFTNTKNKRGIILGRLSGIVKELLDNN